MSPSIADAPFLSVPSLRVVMAAVAGHDEAVMAVGGAVRNSLIGQPVADVDLATTALPEVVMARARAAGLKAVPTGIDHGTVTVVADHTGYEVTTLRADVATDGRRAVVAFTRDFAVDAGRRDFTMNAIYSDAAGRLLDPTGGIADALAGRVRFIGDAGARIREDYLRILRFFRFHAAYGRGAPDPQGLDAATAHREGLSRLSRERIGHEIRKLVTAPGADATLALMAETGILDAALGTPSDPARLSRARQAAAACGLHLALPAALAALGAGRDGAGLDGLSAALRLSNAEREAAARGLAVAASLAGDTGPPAVRQAVYRHGNEAVIAGLLLAAADGGRPVDAVAASLATGFRAPRFPVSGRDLIAAGLPPGPEIGRRLAELEAAWIADDFPAVVDLTARRR